METINTRIVHKKKLLGLLITFSLVAVLTLSASELLAVPLLTVTGDGDLGYRIESNQAAAVSFTLTESFNEVSITADLTGFNAQGGIFLMSNLGPGVWTENVVADVDFKDIAFSGNATVLFTDLTLSPGAYAVVVAMDQSEPGSQVIWNGSTRADVTAADGITDGINLFFDSTDEFPPSSSFDTIFDRSAHFSVSGSNSSVTPVPEPDSWLLVVSGFVVFAFHRNRRKKMGEPVSQRV